MQIANHQAKSGGQKRKYKGWRNMKNAVNKEAREACPDGKEYTSGPMQKGSSFTDGLRRRAIAE